MANFFHLSNTEEFQNLELSYLVELLACEELAASDKEAFDATFKWVCHDVGTRVKDLGELLDYIDLDSLTAGYIEHVFGQKSTCT